MRRRASDCVNQTNNWAKPEPEGSGDQLTARRAGDPDSNPNPGENLFLEINNVGPIRCFGLKTNFNCF